MPMYVYSVHKVKKVPRAKPVALLRLCIVSSRNKLRVTYLPFGREVYMLFIGVYIMLYVHALSMAMTAIGCYCITWGHGHFNIKVHIIYSNVPSCPCLSPIE